jgi:hypothetical protein
MGQQVVFFELVDALKLRKYLLDVSRDYKIAVEFIAETEQEEYYVNKLIGVGQAC